MKISPSKVKSDKPSSKSKGRNSSSTKSSVNSTPKSPGRTSRVNETPKNTGTRGTRQTGNNDRLESSVTLSAEAKEPETSGETKSLLSGMMSAYGSEKVEGSQGPDTIRQNGDGSSKPGGSDDKPNLNIGGESRYVGPGSKDSERAERRKDQGAVGDISRMFDLVDTDAKGEKGRGQIDREELSHVASDKFDREAALKKLKKEHPKLKDEWAEKFVDSLQHSAQHLLDSPDLMQELDRVGGEKPDGQFDRSDLTYVRNDIRSEFPSAGALHGDRVFFGGGYGGAGSGGMVGTPGFNGYKRPLIGGDTYTPPGLDGQGPQ